LIYQFSVISLIVRSVEENGNLQHAGGIVGLPIFHILVVMFCSFRPHFQLQRVVITETAWLKNVCVILEFGMLHVFVLK
jgi:hypothetical protein